MHHRSLPTRKSRNLNIGRIKYYRKIWEGQPVLETVLSDITSIRTTLVLLYTPNIFSNIFTFFSLIIYKQ